MAFWNAALMFLMNLVRWLKPLVVVKAVIMWTSSKSWLMAAFLLKYVRIILTFYFILGFLFDAFVQVFEDHNVFMFMFNVATPFVTAEHQIITSIEVIEAGTVGFWGIVRAYVDIMAALVIFVYMLKLLCWLFSGLASNSSLKGFAPFIFSFALLTIAEFAVLGISAGVMSEGSYEDRISEVFTRENAPLQGLWALANNIPTLVSPFTDAINIFADDPPPPMTADETMTEAVDAVVNTTEESHGGALSGLKRFVCEKTFLC